MGDTHGRSDEELFHLSVAQQRRLPSDLQGPVARVQLVAALPSVTAELIEQRWRDVAGRYDALRTAFVKPAGLSAALQTTAGAIAGLTVEELSSDDVSQTHELAEREWARDFDLLTGGLVRLAVGHGHLVLTAAAAVADAASLQLIARELATGDLAEADPLPFLDYAAWEAEQLEDETADARVARAYWTGLMGEAGEGGGTAGTVYYARDARRIGIAEGGLTDDDWLTAFALVRRVHHADQESPCVLAVAVAGRTDEELEHTIGPLERYVPVIVTDDADRVVAATKARLAADVEAGSRFSMFAPHPHAPAAFTAHAAGVRPAVGSFPVELVVTGGVAALWYDTERVTDAEAGWLAEQVALAARAVRDHPDLPAGEVELLGAAERRFIEEKLIGEGVEVPHPTVPAALLHHATHAPDAVALAQDDLVLTYAELESATRRVARHLGTGGPVGLVLDRSLESVVVALGVMRAGRPYVALEPTHPTERIRAQLEAAGVETVISAQEHLAKLPASVRTLLPDFADVPGADDRQAEVSPTGEDLAYLVFTSGSTGMPKAVAVTQDNLVSYVAGVTARLGLSAESRLASVTSLSTDLGNTSVFGALVNGGTLEVVTDEAVSSGPALARLVRDHAVTGLKITPSHLRALLSDGDVQLELPLLICGGEPLDSALVARCRAAGVQRVVNHYGPTETTVGVLTNELAEAVPGPIALGGPLPHVRARVLDHAGRQVPVGVVGELEIVGSAVAAGYLGDDGSTGFGVDSDGNHRYRSGDLVVLRPDGALVFVGRRDSQVKVRGFRVDLGEIEVRLRAEQEVDDAAAIVRNDAVEAFVVAADNRQPDAPTLLDRLGRELPAHMVPATLHQVAVLPRTSSGKVDRGALEVLASADAGPAAVGRVPSTETEAALLEIWREVLPGSVQGIDDNFFQAGGHSLMATKVIARSRARFSVDLPLHVIFACPTVAAMAADIDARLGATADDLDSLMADLEGMSDDEVAALLNDGPSSSEG